MKKITVIQTILVFLFIAIVACLGAYALVAATASIHQKFTIEVTGDDVRFSLTTTADWSSGADASFSTSTLQNGTLKNNMWTMPDIKFTTTGANPCTEATLVIDIDNKNESVPMSIELSGIMYDSERPDYPRFKTNVSYNLNDSGYDDPGKEINGGNFALDSLTFTNLKIKITYKLCLYNSSFSNDLNQIITMKISTPEAEK